MVYILYLGVHHLKSFAVFQKEQKIKLLVLFLCMKSEIFYIICMFDFKLENFKEHTSYSIKAEKNDWCNFFCNVGLLTERTDEQNSGQIESTHSMIRE